MSGPSTMRLLLVEDSPKDAALILNMLAQAPIDVTHVSRMSEAEEHLACGATDVVLLDLGLSDAKGIEAVRRSHAIAPRVPLVVLTGLDDEALAAQVLQAGAQEHLIKGQIDRRGLFRAIRYAVERMETQVQRDVMEEALFVEKERAQVTLTCIAEAVACTDTFGRVTFLNPVGERMTGWSAQAASGQRFNDVFSIVDSVTRAPVRDVDTFAIESGSRTVPSQLTLVRRDGFEVPIEHSVAAMHDRHGHVVGTVFVFRDVSEARTMALKIAHSAEHDFLTGLPNRMLLIDRIDQAIALASRHRTKSAVLFLDLDGFKHINDSLGHPVGDKLLQSVGRRLLDCVRSSDTVSRQGGDEFVVLLSEVADSEDAAVTAKRMLNAVIAPHAIAEHSLHVTASIGVSAYPDDGRDAETLIKNADTAMYQAKENGRQSYQFFTPAMNARAVERQSIEEGLHAALERQEFALLYQPKVDVKTGRITGAEALIRWTHPLRGPIPPLDFIPVAEACGLIRMIGNWVLREACSQARAWRDAGLPAITMAVNISALELRDAQFVDGVLAVLAETDWDPNLLELELTESTLMKKGEGRETALKALRAEGVQLAIDDFGTGYSSLSYLKTLPLSTLKIDQSFVRQITTAPDETAIVEAVISMARSLKLRVVAEGVETQEELAFLRALHCDEAQGYLIGHPVPPDRFSQLGVSG